MAKIMVFQHVPYEPLGTLDALLRDARHRIRYVNFARTPKARPDIRAYDALIVLGGPMNVDQENIYPNLKYEQQVIVQAHELGIPVLGICLGAQLIASAFGAKVYPAKEAEIGWYKLQTTPSGRADSVVASLKPSAKVFQWHGYTFDLPEQAELLVQGEQCVNQAFRIGKETYGFQFHLEVELDLIQRWLNLPQHRTELGLDSAEQRIDAIWRETMYYIDQSLAMSRQVFSAFLDKLPQVNQKVRFVHHH